MRQPAIAQWPLENLILDTRADGLIANLAMVKASQLRLGKRAPELQLPTTARSLPRSSVNRPREG